MPLKRTINKIPCECLTCGTVVLRFPSEIKKRVYCSPRCYLNKAPAPLEFSVDGLTARIPLLTHQGAVRAFATIDAADAALVSPYRWHLTVQGYAARDLTATGGRGVALLHRELLGLAPGDGLEGDHIDRDRLNCRRENLRPLPDGKNSQNITPSGASGHRGVWWSKVSKKWQAGVKCDGKYYHLGLFVNQDDAVRAALAGRKRLLPFATD